MRIFITGISSFVGTNLARIFRTYGHDVSGSSTRRQGEFGVVQFRFGDAIPQDLFHGMDVVVHAAWSLDSSDGDLNLESTRSLVALGRKTGVKRQIFLSSQSASENAVSTYGSIKFQAEALFDPRCGDVIVRPGLIVGEGGLFRRTFNLVSKSYMIPLIGGGSFPMPLIGINDLGQCLERLLAGPSEHRALNLYYRHVPTQKEFLEDLVNSKNWKRIFISIPGPIAIAILQGASLLRIPTTISKESVMAALHNRILPSSSDLERFIGAERSYAALINSISEMT